MKNISTLFIMSLLLFFSVSAFGQSRGGKTIIDPKNPGNSVALSATEFEESVLILQDLSEFLGKSELKKSLTLELVNFNDSRKLLPAYRINGVEYSDNGKFNDIVAGDGVFTSVTTHRVKGSAEALSARGAKSNAFAYTQELLSFRKGIYASSQRGIGLSCKIRLVTCPETTWYNSCWPMSSPCQCVEFFDCEVSVGLE
ncbi:MAG: hypothetical protein ACI828_001207 [Flavobacteriales bacterium]|jgi:hypothetical protein